ncbi:MAG: hypothetical protein K0S29_1199, partial [Gammaproteobacteria bacterium]|nr:hypothetical protein [Gammaproteobacteria bacterium]
DVLAVSQPESDHSADVLDHVEVVAEPPKSAHVAPATAQAENLALPFPGQDQSEGQAQVQTQGPSSVLNKTAGDEYSDLMVSSVTLTAAPENPAQKSGHWWAGMRIDSPAPVPAIVVAKSATSMRQIRYEGVDDVLMTDYERL